MRLCLVAMLLVEATASPILAADISVPSAASAPSDWIISIGADARAVPLYTGSNKWGTLPLPYVGSRRPGSPEAFHSARDATGIALFDNDVIALGPVGALIFPRSESSSSALNGLGNLGFTYQVGGFIDYWAVPWLRTRAEALQGFGAADGVTANFSLDAVIPLFAGLTLSGGPRARVVSAGAESTYFSVTAAQSMASGLPIYNAGGAGRRSVRARSSSIATIPVGRPPPLSSMTSWSARRLPHQ